MRGRIIILLALFSSSIYFLGKSEDLKNQHLRGNAAVVPMVKDKLMGTLRNWGLFNTKSTSHISILEAWKLEKGSKDIVVAVIDTGVDTNHVDLKQNIWHGDASADRKVSKLSKEVIKTKVKGAISKIFGWDFVTGKPNPEDLHGHGTHVAGIIGAVTDPKAGISGVAPNVSIMPVKYYSDSNPGSVNLANTIKAIHFAVDNGAKIINYSGGGPSYSHEERLALKRAEAAGILVVAAAGNEKQDTDIPENYYYPAAYGLSNIITVAATDINNQLLDRSNWGKTKVDVAAPGQDILSTLPKNRYGTMSGTSQATAFVTGLSALLLSRKPTLTPQEIKKIITNNVDLLPQLRDRVASGGKLNAYKALLAVINPSLSNSSTRIEKSASSPTSFFDILAFAFDSSSN